MLRAKNEAIKSREPPSAAARDVIGPLLIAKLWKESIAREGISPEPVQRANASFFKAAKLHG